MFDVAIIIPVYNRNIQLKRALDSIYSQNFNGSILIIIVDDGSEEEVKIEKLEKPNFKTILIKQNNQGPAAARNTGLKVASAKIILYLDSDDELVYDALKIIYYEMINKDIDLFHFGLLKHKYNPGQYKQITQLLEGFLLNRVLGYGVAFARSNRLTKLLGNWNVETRVGEDKEYCLRSIICSIDNKFKFESTSKKLYKVNNDSINHLNNGIQVKNSLEKTKGSLVVGEFICKTNNIKDIINNTKALSIYFDNFWNMSLFGTINNQKTRFEEIKKKIKSNNNEYHPPFWIDQASKYKFTSNLYLKIRFLLNYARKYVVK